MNALLTQISEHASDDLKSLIESGETDILAAIYKMEAEAQLQDSKPKFSLGFKITLDLDKNTFDCDLSWTMKQTLGVSHQIEDPAQSKLPINNYLLSCRLCSLAGARCLHVTGITKTNQRSPIESKPAQGSLGEAAGFLLYEQLQTYRYGR